MYSQISSNATWARGRGRGRGRARGHGRGQIPRRGSAATAPLALGASVRTVSVDELLLDQEEQLHSFILDSHVVGSFNWLKGFNGSILAPGMPPRWTPLPGFKRLREDSVECFRDLNAANYPDHPIEPTIEAIMHQVQDNGKMDRIGPVDIVACGSTLSSLLRFVLGQRQSFRMQVEAIDETVHLIRRSGSPLETIPDIRGYGHTFPEANTTWDSCAKGSVSHQRILSYQFGGLGCIVRFEGDGYLLEKAGELRTEAQAKGSQSNKTVNSTSLEALADGLALSTSNQYTKPEGPVKIQSGGSLIPQNAIYDLKTRSIRRKPEEQAIIAEEIPRLWVKQITNLILAFHRSGTFEDIQVHDLGLAIEEWEFVNRDALERFRALLQLIMDEASQRKDGKLEVICNEEEQLLHIREQGPGCQSALSPDVERRWKHWLDKCRSAKGGLTGKSDNQGGAPLFWEEDYVLDRDYDSEDAKDFTACDLECGYCGRCDY